MRNTPLAILLLLTLNAPLVLAQDPIALGSHNGVTMYSVPQDSPHAPLQSSKIVLKTDNASALMVALEDIKIEGNVIQTWSTLGGPNVLGPQGNSPIYRSLWSEFDTHLLVTDDMIVGEEYIATETNDRSLGIGACPPHIECEAFPVMGIGPTQLSSSTGAIRLHAEYQSNELDLAQVVWTESASVTVGVTGEGFVKPGLVEKAFFDATPLQPNRPPRFCATSFADFCYDFDHHYARHSSGTIGGDGRLSGSGGYQDSAYVSVNDNSQEQSGVMVLQPGDKTSLILAGRTTDLTSVHDIDNIEVFDRDANRPLKVSAYLRIGGGSDLPGEGFSFSVVPNSDQTTTGDGNGFVGINGETNLPEEGTYSGISISLDERQTGPPSSRPNTDLSSDIVGITLRYEGDVIGQASLPTLHGALDDPTSLQTGPNTGEIDDLGWAILTIEAPPLGTKLPDGYDNAYLRDNFTVTWKGKVVELFPIPEPDASLMSLWALIGLSIVRRSLPRMSRSTETASNFCEQGPASPSGTSLLGFVLSFVGRKRLAPWKRSPERIEP